MPIWAHTPESGQRNPLLVESIIVGVELNSIEAESSVLGGFGFVEGEIFLLVELPHLWG